MNYRNQIMPFFILSYYTILLYQKKHPKPPKTTLKTPSPEATGCEILPSGAFFSTVWGNSTPLSEKHFYKYLICFTFISINNPFSSPWFMK